MQKRTVVDCLIGSGRDGTPTERVRSVGTMTADLLRLADWLAANEVTHVAMESTGVYWRPLYYLLEDGFTVLLINMQHLSHVPGRKSDVRDSEWLAQLFECGLLRGSLVPPAAIRDLRDLTRYRSGRAMVEALLHGTTDPTVLADLARGRLRRKLPALQQALRGQFRPQHAFLVTQILAKIDFLDEAIDTLTTEIDRQLAPFEPTVTRLMTIPGLARRNAITVFVETGGDMRHFPTAAHLCSWGSMCPGQKESAGKRQTGKTRDGNRYLRGALIEAGLATTRARGTALQARYYRIKRHRGHKKAVVAVGHQILEIAFYVMRDGVTYQELGADYFDRRDRERTTRRHIKQLEALGFKVTLETAA
jgi:transposase